MWQQIINPKSGNKIDIRSKRGKYILNRYIKQLQIGGTKFKNRKQKIEHFKALKEIQEEELRRQQAYLDKKFTPNETENILEEKLTEIIRNYNLETEEELEKRTRGIVKPLIIPGLTVELGEDDAISSEEENRLRFMNNEQLLNNFMGLENDDELSRLESSNDREYNETDFNEDEETDIEEMDFEDENREKINMLESMSYDQLRNELDKIPHLINISSDDEIQKNIEDIEDILIYKDDMSDGVEDFLRLSLKLFKARLKPPNPPKIAKK